MRRYFMHAMLVLGAAIAGPAAAQEWGRVYGTVTDAETGEPIPGARLRVSIGFAPATSGSDGRYEMRHVHPLEMWVEAWKDGYYNGAVKVVVPPRGQVRADIRLSRNPPPPGLSLAGTWRVTMTVDSVFERTSARPGDVFTGTFTFGEALRGSLHPPVLRLEHGEWGVDLAGLLGAEAWDGVVEDVGFGAAATVWSDSSVEVRPLPIRSHFLRLRGKADATGNVIAGRWAFDAYPVASGTFVMRRER